MSLSEVRLQNFRSYTDASFEVSSGVNIIVGPNASGKTNLLEALLVLARGASYRAKDSELIRFGEPWARIETSDETENSRVVKLVAENNGFKKSFDINGQAYQRLSSQKSLPVVVFEPNHLLLLTGSPDMRRSFMDDLIEQTTTNYGAIRQHYRRALAQRNALLKKGLPSAKAQIFVWNLRLSELAGKIVQERRTLIEQINSIASETYQGLSDTMSNIHIGYRTTCPEVQYETALLHRLEANLERDALLGFTSHGPHRDDMTVQLNGHPSSETASRGETRTIILMLKIIELRLLERIYSTTPLLLLDDVFSELDGKRRQALTTFLQSYQTFITTTDADIVVQHFMNSCHVIPLSAGY